MAPIKIKLAFLLSIPSNMKEPSPPAPTSAASVAVPIIITVAVLIPDTITGIASGISKVLSLSHLFMPNAIPASSRLGSMPLSAVIVFSNIGNMAYITSAVSAGFVPIPISGMKRPKSAIDGTVWRIPASCNTHFDARLCVLR